MSQAGPVTLAYRYATPSVLLRDELSLAPSGGVTEAGPAVHPYFFTGFLAGPGPAAQALLATAAIARAQYHAAARTIQMLRDPVVTSNTGRPRFESFSVCCGVHARLDLPPGSPRSRAGRVRHDQRGLQSADASRAGGCRRYRQSDPAQGRR